MIQRNSYKRIKEHLEKKEISLLIGPRQAGKTTIMKQLQAEIKAETRTPTLFLNLDIESDSRHFTSQDALLNKIHLEVGSGRSVIFIDEIQRKENAGLFLKGLYDMNLPYKWVVSGSGSVELKEKVHESLAGRKRIFEIGTLSWNEFVQHRTAYQYGKNLEDFFRIEPEKTHLLLKEYMNYGGYPRVVLEEKHEDKKNVMEEIMESYLIRDIGALIGIKKTESFSHLVRLLAAQTGGSANIEGLANTLGVSSQTVNHYLWNLEHTYIIERVTPWFRQVAKEISKMPKFYFHDLGLPNIANGSFGNDMNNESYGRVFENFMLHILKENYKDSASDIHYWRTKDGAEVDFVLERGIKTVPCEIKYQNLDKKPIPSGIRSFIERYRPESAIIIHLGIHRTEVIGKTEVTFVPWWEYGKYEFTKGI